MHIILLRSARVGGGPDRSDRGVADHDSTESAPCGSATGGEPMIERYFTTWDGARLFYRAWLPDRPAGKALVLFHRGHEHSGRLQELVRRLGLADFAVFAWDARGHGRSPGERGWAANFACLVRDADSFVKHVTGEYSVPLQSLVVVAPGVGGAIA